MMTTRLMQAKWTNLPPTHRSGQSLKAGVPRRRSIYAVVWGTISACLPGSHPGPYDTSKWRDWDLVYRLGPERKALI